MTDDVSYFCENADCDLHVNLAEVCGSGDWAELADGILVSNIVVEGRLLCDFCARRLLSMGVVVE